MPNQYPDEPFGRQPRVMTGPAPANTAQGQGNAGAQAGAQDANTRTYQGQSVTLIRAAKEGDQGFDPGAGDQSLIRMQGGAERVVPTADLQNASTG